MTHPRVLTGALVASLLSVGLAGQTPNRTAGTDLLAGPLVLSGMASSARHCVSGDAANVHGIGWVAAGTSYTISFDSAIALASAVANVNLGAGQATSGFGTPDLRFTASTSGSMALYVSGRGQAGCYRYKVEIQQPSPSVAPAAGAGTPSAIELVKPAKHPIRMMAISGAASSAKHCVTGTGAKIHGIGRVEQGAGVRVTFDSDFDPVAGMTLVNLAPERATFIVDDDSGGDLEPLLNFTASQSGTLALHVGSVGGRSGCYHYQVQIQGESAPTPSPTPAPTPTPTPTPSPSTYAVTQIPTTCTQTGRSGGDYSFTVVQSGTATGPDVGAFLDLSEVFLGISSTHLACGAWSYSDGTCRRASGQSATTSWTATIVTPMGYRLPGSFDIQASVRSPTGSLRATQSVRVTCTGR